MASSDHEAYESHMCFQSSVLDAISREIVDATEDTGPLDTLSAAELERAYDEFYGTSPLSTPFASPASSRSTSPTLAELHAHRKRKASQSPEPRVGKAQSASKARRDKKKSRLKRRAARAKARAASNACDTPANAGAATPRDSSVKKHVEPSTGFSTSFSAADIPCASTGYKAKPDALGRVYTLDELLQRGFKVLSWDGRKSVPILDRERRVVAALVGRPDDPGWDEVHRSAHSALQDAAPRCRFTKKCAKHRRGEFRALNAGISFGGGQMSPGNLCHSAHRRDVLNELLAHPSFQRLSGFASSAFSTWMPKLYDYYSDSFRRLLLRHGTLRRNFKRSVWAAAAFNFGPRTVTAKHRDFANLPFGVCAITALGQFDATRGGHLVLWELGLVVEFPAGSTVLLPSAAVAHSNTPIAANECRSSYTQYTAGGLFRWVEQGFQTSRKFMNALSDPERASVDAQNAARCKLGLSLFSTLSELQQLGCGRKSGINSSSHLEGDSAPGVIV